MDDSTIVRLCAEAMGLPFREVGGEIQFRVPSSRGLNDWVTYRPLHDDAAALALGKAHPDDFEFAVIEWRAALRRKESVSLNRILCERIAKRGKHEL